MEGLIARGSQGTMNAARHSEMRPVSAETLPETIETIEDLDEILTRPDAQLVEFVKTIPSPLVILGAGGKMGPTLAVLVRRAAEQAGHKLDIIAVSRYSDPRVRDWLEKRKVRTLSCNLLDSNEVSKLPCSANVLYLVGLKFGTVQNPALTWAANTVVPAYVAEHYREARIVALSTGNVYPFSKNPAGAVETDPLTPLGEYANAAIGRERVFEFFSKKNATPVILLRLFYAVELRYGVLRDLADKIWNGQPIHLDNGSLNCIWQADANHFVIRSLGLAATPAAVFNLTSQQPFKVRTVAMRLGNLLGKPVHFAGEESETSLTGNCEKLFSLLGSPVTNLENMLRWTAEWIKRGGPSLGKPTHFEIRDGSY
jgi:nucleoside-diphosphate-sugar epimerase